MWLSNSSVGRKVVMSVTGIVTNNLNNFNSIIYVVK